jgi:bifunctional pyridoxal-dependent enzyme with beta-cystathionase and maltose regulon repressor activities
VFVWIDLSYALEQSTEIMDSKREAAVTERLIEAGVKLAPGRKFRTEEVGWYRLTFARPASDLTTAVKR